MKVIKYFTIITFIQVLLSFIYSIDDATTRLDVVYSLNEKIYYIIVNGYYYSITDSAAVAIITPNPAIIESVNILDINYKNGGIYPYFKGKKLSKENLVVSVINYIEDVSHGNGKLLYDIVKLEHEGADKIFNGAIVPVDNVYLAVDRVGFFWLNKNFVYDKKLNNERQKITYPMFEEDHRLFLLPSGDILTTYTALIPEFHHKVGLRLLYKDKVVNGITKYKDLSQGVILLTKDDAYNQTQKNWIPFNYDSNHIFFIKHFEPFHIIQIDTSKSREPVRLTHNGVSINVFRMSTVSKVLCTSFHWLYGGVRGGTPALLVRGQYLAFFHTKSRMMNIFRDLDSDARLYFNGAYTFSRTLPFRITGMTKYPIMHRSFRPYDNPRVGMDYVVYFMSYVVVDKNNKVILEGQEEEDPATTTIVLTIGINDADTVTAKINLNALLESMTEISCQDTGNIEIQP